MAEAASASPYKGPSKTELAERKRRFMLVPLLVVPLGITAYFAFWKENSKGLTWFSLRRLNGGQSLVGFKN
jgi:hypothetical protein